MDIAVSDNAALAIAAAIREQTAVHSKIETTLGLSLVQLQTLTAFLAANHSVAAASTPGSPAASLRVIAGAFNDSAQLSGYLIKNQSEVSAMIDKISTGLASISAHIAQGVTTQQIVAADNIRNNKFQQQTTNDALERAKLPKTEVTPAKQQEAVGSAISDVADLKLQVAASNLVANTITDGLVFAQTQLLSWVSQTWIGSAATTAWGQLKQFVTLTDPKQETAITTTSTNAAQRSTLTLQTVVPPDILST